MKYVLNDCIHVIFMHNGVKVTKFHLLHSKLCLCSMRIITYAVYNQEQ
jgi:hypothetical protein